MSTSTRPREDVWGKSGRDDQLLCPRVPYYCTMADLRGAGELGEIVQPFSLVVAVVTNKFVSCEFRRLILMVDFHGLLRDTSAASQAVWYYTYQVGPSRFLRGLFPSRKG